MYKNIGYFAASVFEYPPKSGAGNPHALGPFFMVQPLEVGQPESFEFVLVENLLLQFTNGDASRFVVIGGGVAVGSAHTTGSWHGTRSFASGCYEHMLKTKIRQMKKEMVKERAILLAAFVNISSRILK